VIVSGNPAPEKRKTYVVENLSAAPGPPSSIVDEETGEGLLLEQELLDYQCVGLCSRSERWRKGQLHGHLKIALGYE